MIIVVLFTAVISIVALIVAGIQAFKIGEEVLNKKVNKTHWKQ